MSIALNRLKRLASVLLPAFFVPAQLFFFGPLAVYAANEGEFAVPFWPLSARWVWPMLALGTALAAAAVAIPEWWRYRFVAFLVAFGALLWMQGNLLLADYGLLTGVGLDLASHRWRAPYELALWVAGIGVTVALAATVSTVASLTAGLLMALQGVALVVPILSVEAETDQTEWRTPPEGIYELSRGTNIIHLVLDGFQSGYFGEILEDERATFDRDFSGVVFFEDHLGAFPTTRASMPAMFTGVAYRNEMPFETYLERTNRDRSVFKILSQQGFDIRSISFHPFDHPAPSILSGGKVVAYSLPTPYGSYRDYVDFSAAQLLDLSLFRQVPHGFKASVYNDQAWQVQRWLAARRPPEHAARVARASSHALFLEEFGRRLSVGGSDPAYTFMHLAIPHPPIVVDETCHVRPAVALSVDSYRAQVRCSLLMVQRLFDRLRELGIYEESAIVLTSDHGWTAVRGTHPLNGLRSPADDLDRVALSATPLLAVKAPGATGPVVTSTAPTSITDMPATLLDLVGLPNYFGRGRSVLEIDPEESRRRQYAHHSWSNADWGRTYFDVLYIFSVSGPVTEPESWRFERSVFEPTGDLLAQLEDHEAGLLDVEQLPDGPFRWTTHQAVVYVPPQSERFSVQVQKAPSVAAQTVSVRVDGRVVDQLELGDDSWQTIDVLLEPRGAAASPFCIELLVTPYWRDDHNRRIGVRSRDIAWMP